MPAMNNSDGLEIYKADSSDTADLCRVGIESYVPYYSHLWKDGGLEWYLERCFGVENLRTELSSEEVEYYFIKSNGKIAGFIKIVLLKPVPNAAKDNALYLEKIYFAKEFLGKGFGQTAIEFVIKRARNLGRKYVWLMAMDTAEKPIKAYETAGFSICSTTRLDFELMKEEFRGMVVMNRCLD